MVAPGTLFSYLGAFVTIVLALGLSDLLISLHRLLRHASKVKWAMLPLACALFVLLSLLSEFFSIWSLTMVSRVTFGGLILHLLPTFFIFLAASTVLPDDIDPDGVDLDSFYFSQRRYIYITLACAFFADAPRASLAFGFSFEDLLVNVAGPSFALGLAFLALAFSRWRWLHWLVLGAALALIGTLFPTLYIEAPPAATIPQ
jgi:hypothetical protein